MVEQYLQRRHDVQRLLSVAILALLAVLVWCLQRDYLEQHFDDTRFSGGLGWIFIALMAMTSLRYWSLIVLATADKFRRLPQFVPEPSRAWPTVSVIVPAFNEGVTIGDSLASLLRLDYPGLEIIVIDDGSPDDTYVKAHNLQRQAVCAGKSLKLLTQSNAGKAEALNLGISVASGELVLCIDADGIIAGDALMRAVRHFADPTVGAVSGSVRVFNRKTAFARMQALEYLTGLGLPKAAQSFGDSVLLVPGPLGLFRKSAIISVGGYDTDTFAEDFDLSLKLLGAGWRVRYDHTVQGATECPVRLMDLIKQRYRWSRGAYQVLRKRRRGWRALSHRPMTVLGAWCLTFESLFMPFLNVVGQCAFVLIGLIYGVHEGFVLWWLQALLLDMAAAAYCLQAEGEQPSLLLIAPMQRVFYTTFIDLLTLLSVLDEWRGLRMEWGLLPRAGGLR